MAAGKHRKIVQFKRGGGGGGKRYILYKLVWERDTLDMILFYVNSLQKGDQVCTTLSGPVFGTSQYIAARKGNRNTLLLK